MAGTSTDNPRTDAARERTGHDAPPARKRPVVGGRSIDKDARTRAYVAALQRDLNRHLVLLGSPTVLAVDGVWEHDTDVAFRRVCRVLGLEPKRSVRTFRAIGGAIAPPTAEELEKSRTDGAAYEKQLRHHFAHAPIPKPKPKPDPDPEPVGDAALEAALRKAGARYEREIVREAKRSGLPISLICAVLEVETGFRNVFGHDNVRNPIKSPPGGLLAVTPDLYRQYLGFRRQGLGNQGVGPMQLTSPGLQDRADALGGCSKVGPNIRVGVEFLAGNIRRLGLFGGVAAYNGSNAYATKVLPLEKKWRAKLGRCRRRPERRRQRPAHAPGGHGGLRRAGAPNARQPALRGVEGRPAHRRGRRLRPRHPQGRAPGRLRPRRRHRRVRQRHHARAALQAAPPEPPHDRGPGPRPAPAAVAAQAPRRQHQLRHLPARRARADHRHALPRHAHARELAVRQRARHPDPQRHAGDRARRRRRS